MNRRPTPKAGIVAAIGGVLVAVATTAQAGWLFVLAAGVLGLAVSGLVVSHRLAAAEIVHAFPARARVGEAVAVTMSVRSAANRRLPLMRVEDRFPAFDPVAVASEPIRAGAAAAVELTRVAVARGVFEGGSAELSTGAPFGLTRTKRKTDVRSRLIVHPAWTELRTFPLPDTPAATADEALAAARSGQGELFAGVRDYRPGDLRKWVHWRSTARTGRLVVREHEEPARSPVVLVLAGELAASHEDVWETLVAAAASVGVHALDEGRPLHCLCPGTVAALDNATRATLLDWCAGVSAPGAAAVDGVGAAFGRWGRRCAFVILGPPGADVDEAVAAAQARGAGVTVVYGAGEEGALAESATRGLVVRPGEELRACLEG
ncbi:MAG TPA: DUF58 domain-containing protein [Actinomycetota bacterium]|nr:DUF58 domain-containing protein [Actinomycetota bacterium]